MTIIPPCISSADFANQLGWPERRLRQFARRLGACRVMGNRMIFLVEDVRVVLASIGRPTDQIAMIPPRQPSYRGSHVYFFRQEDFVKIGWSNKWRSRLSTIQSTTPFQVTPLAVYRGGIALERDLHAKFAEHRVRLEWFRYCDAIREYIETNKFKCVKDARSK